MTSVKPLRIAMLLSPTLEAVVGHYMRVLGLNLESQQRTDLVQFLRSL